MFFQDFFFGIYETVAMQIMKREQSQLSQEAHECVEGIPELYKMVDGVQALGEFTSTQLVLKMGFKGNSMN